MKQRSGFTLIEVAIAIAILAAGSTACITMFITGLKWTEEVKINASAAFTAQSVINAPQVFEEDARNKDAPYLFTKDSKGWINGYYAVRTVSDLETIVDRNGSATGGYVANITVYIYHGGDESDGELVYSISNLKHFRTE